MNERSNRTIHISAGKDGFWTSFTWFDRDGNGKPNYRSKIVETASQTELESVRKLFNKLDAKFYVGAMDGEKLSLLYDIPTLLDPLFDEAVSSDAPLAVMGSLFENPRTIIYQITH